MNNAATASTEDESQTSFRSVNSARGKGGFLGFIGLSLLAFIIVAAIRNLTYYTTITHGTLEWGRIDNGTISGTLQLSEVQRISCVDGTDEGFHIAAFLKSGKWVVIDGRYFCGNSDARRLLSFVGEHCKEIKTALNGPGT
jgi:hypothetical protein